MRKEPDFFEDRPLALVYIGKTLSESKAMEEVLTNGGINYVVEVDYYTGGVIFRRERAGAFFYVEEHWLERAQTVMRDKGYRPFDDATGTGRENVSR